MLNSIIKDLKVNIFDGKQMLIILAMPVILTIILSFALGGTLSSGGTFNAIDIAVVKQYDADLSEEDILASIEELSALPPQAAQAYKQMMSQFSPESIFFDDFLDSDGIKEIINYEVLSKEEAKQKLDELKISAIVYMPENFIIDTYSNMFGHKKEVQFDLTVDEAKSYSGGIAKLIIKAFTDSLSMSFANNEVFSEVAAEYLSDQELMQMVGVFQENMNKYFSRATGEIGLETVEQYKTVDSFMYYSMAMLCMFMLFSAGIGGRSMLEEKDNLTYYRMKVLGVTYFQMMVSKLIVVLIICLLQTVVMIGLSTLAFGVDWGNYLTVALIALCGSFAIGGMGSFIGAISLRSGNYKLANTFEGAIVQVMAIIGGSYIPLSVLPKVFTKISRFTINGQALSAYIKNAQGMSVGHISFEIMVILISGVIFFAGAWLIIRAEGKRENA